MRKILSLKSRLVLFILIIYINAFSQNLVTVTDCNLNGWVKQIPANTSLTFKNDPAFPILGKGSLEMITIAALKNVRLRNTNYNNTLLSTVTAMSFSSFIAHRENDYDAPFVVLQIDLNDDGKTDNFLEFGPQYQSAPWSIGVALDQGAVMVGKWQTWDILHGVFWLGPDIDPEHGGPVFNLATYIAQHPTAKIINDAAIGGGIRLSAGGFAPNFKCYTDNFHVGVNGATTIYDFEFTTANAGPDKNVIYGYGSNCTSLNGSAAGGVAPYTYSWSPTGDAPNSSNTIVCPTDTTMYTLTVTDKNGCVRSDDVVVNVLDVRCGSKLDKVAVCHNGQEICIAQEAVAAHLGHGDILGACQQSSAITNRTTASQQLSPEQKQLKISTYPNPFLASATIEYVLPADGKVEIRLYDVMGKEIAELANGDKKAGLYTVEFNRDNIPSGTYYARLILFSGRYYSQTQRLLILPR